MKKTEKDRQMQKDNRILLNSGIEMDRIGMGCWESRGSDAVAAVGYAVRAGYRRIDTAAYYGNESEIGAGIRSCGVPREDLFIATKLWFTDMNRAEEAFYQSLERLGLDYLDLYFLHWPIGDVKGAWRVLERLYEAGIIRSIGVSNFQQAHLEQLLAFANVCPAVDQFESNPRFAQGNLRKFCIKEGIVPEAWGPLGKGRDLTLPLIDGFSKKYEKTPAQIILRWHLQHGMTMVPKSVHEKRLKENLNIFDFTLEEADMRAIDSLDTGISTRNAPPEYCPI